MNPNQAALPLLTAAGQVVATLVIRVLPTNTQGTRPPLEVADTNAPDGEALEKVRLLEDCEYGYKIEGIDLPEDGAGLLEPQELFSLDVRSGEYGRLRPGSHAGRLLVTLRQTDGSPATAWVEVRSRKLDYLTDYRHMMRDIAEVSAEALMERFAPTVQRFEPDESSDPRTLYQRFAFVQALVRDDAFQAAIQRVLHRPHHAWQTIHIERRASAAVPAGSAIQRQLSRPGPRIKTPHLPAPSVPERFTVPIHIETVDTLENRFVKFVLLAMRDITARIGDALGRASERTSERAAESAPIARGRTEVAALIETLDEWLSHGLFREVGRLRHLPLNSQVLQKKQGYRDVLRAWLQLECAARLSWTQGEGVYHAGQHDVASLYEHWVFMQVARIVAELCGTTVDLSALIRATDNDLSLDLARGKSCVLKSSTTRNDRKVEIHVYYNRSFTRHDGSWTRPMIPDISVHVDPDGAEDFWIHLDAKYRIQTITDAFGPLDDGEGVSSLTTGVAKRDDLLKMHAYRDAIRGSSGAYVIYPGDDTEKRKRYHEILPGLGAFPLRPSAHGDARGAAALKAFLEETLRHAGARTTQHERGRYWERRIFGTNPVEIDHHAHALAFLEAPPADTTVLLGYVKSQAHLDWIESNKFYNVRAIGPKSPAQPGRSAAQSSPRRGAVAPTATLLAAPFVILYGKDVGVRLYRVAGDVETWPRDHMASTGYPDPGGALYHCLPLERVQSSIEQHLTYTALDQLRAQAHAPFGAPVCLSWDALLARQGAPPERAVETH